MSAGTHSIGGVLGGTLKTKLNKHMQFQTVACVRCGQARSLEQHCPACNQKPRPGEINPYVAERRKNRARIQSLV